jgi:hypothetical protein
MLRLFPVVWVGVYNLYYGGGGGAAAVIGIGIGIDGELDVEFLLGLRVKGEG